MKKFEVTGQFMAADIDDALRFLGRHFTSAAAGEVELGGAAHIFDVRPLTAEDSPATGSAEAS